MTKGFEIRDGVQLHSYMNSYHSAACKSLDKVCKKEMRPTKLQANNIHQNKDQSITMIAKNN